MGNKQQQQQDQPQQKPWTAWMDVEAPRLTPEELQRRQEMLNRMMQEDEEYEDSLLSPKRPVKAPILQGFTSDILSLADFKFLAAKLPAECTRSTWIQLFSAAKHGKSFTTFYSSIAHRGPVVVVVEDKQGHVFGGFASPNVELDQKEYFGDMSSFLFTVAPHARTFMPTGLNSNLIFLNASKHRHKPRCFAMGGSSSAYYSFALRIHDDLEQGESNEHISTFNNSVLSGKKHFAIEKLEVWGFSGLEAGKQKPTQKMNKFQPMSEGERLSAKFVSQEASEIFEN